MKLMTSKPEVEAPEVGRRERQRLAREERVADAMDAANRRQGRLQGISRSVAKQVELASVTLNRPAAQVRDILDKLSPRDLEIHILAEQRGKNRVSVLQGYPKPSAAVAEAYELETRSAPQAAVSA